MVLNDTAQNPKRMIVLLPECLANDIDLAREIHLMAFQSQCSVLYLTLLSNNDRMLSVSRNMVTFKALTSGNEVLVQSKLVDRSRWLKALRDISKPGDQIICHEEQCVSSGFLRTVPMRDFLCHEFTAPIVALSGYYHPQSIQLKQWVSSLLTWAGFFLILGMFTFWEIQMGNQLSGSNSKLLFLILLLVEFGAIYAWNTITSHGR